MASLDDKKKYLCSNVRYLSHDDHLRIGELIKHGNAESATKADSHGTKVNLEKLSEDLLDKIYNFVVAKTKPNVV